MIVNVWLALRDAAQALVIERLDWDESVDGIYGGPIPDRAVRLFEKMAHRNVAQGHYRIDNDGANDWVLWNLIFNERRNVLIKVKGELDWLIATYSTQSKIAGAWHYSDGRQVGTTIEYDENGVETGVTGSPIYPVHARILEFMPDDVDEFDVHTRPIMPSDVNLLQGQQERRFVS